MQLIRGQHNLSAQHRGCVLTIGNFDGLHLGHQALLALLSETASKYQTRRCLMTFDPLPHEFFTQRSTTTGVTARLMTTREKLMALSDFEAQLRPDYMLLMNFNDTLAAMVADDFIQHLLIDSLSIRALIVGDDFRFGKGRDGDIELLKASGTKNNFEVVALSTHCVDNMRVSSTRIRQALQSDQLADAMRMLGRPYQICGRVAHGDKRGRTIGFPTANIHLKRSASPLHGVYAVTMVSNDTGTVSGIANVGHRPTVEGERIQLEVHLFDFDQDIYGHNVCVSFHKKIRDEKKFESFDELKQQIELDCTIARQFHQTADL